MSHGHKFRPETRHVPKALDKIYLRVVWQREPIVIRALDGSRVISKCSNVFSSFIQAEFNNLNLSDWQTPETPVKIFKNVADGTFFKIFNSLPGCWDEKYFNQDQIIAFCEDNPELIDSEKAVIFLCIINPEENIIESRPHENLIIVSVSRDKDGLMVDKDSLDRPTVWPKEVVNLFVVPKYQ